MTYTEPRLEVLGPRLFQYIEDYVYEWEHEGAYYRVIIPQGYTYDAGSVPLLAEGIIPRLELRGPAGPHDYFYQHVGCLPAGHFQRANYQNSEWENVDTCWTREDVDRLFGRMLRESGIAVWKRRVVYLAVRAWAWRAWEFYKRQEGR